MRLGYLTASILRLTGGLRDSVRREASALRNCGAEVEVFAVGDSDSALDLVEWKALKVNLVRSAGLARFSYAPGFSDVLADADLDVLASHGLWRYTSIAASKWHARTHRPYIVSPHGMLDPWALRNSRFRKRLAGFFFEDNHLEGASCIRALCGAEATAIRNYGLRNPIAIIPNGVDLPEIGNGNAERGNVSWANTIEPGRKVLLFLSRIAPKKGLVNLLKAWAASRKSDEWVLVIAGLDENGHEGELKKLTSELELQTSVKFPGPQFDASKDALFRRASAFILPSFSEGLPLAVLEAWAYRKPVLLTPQCNLPEGVAAGAAIQILPETKDIADGLIQLFEMTPEQLDEMGQKGQSFVNKHFTWPEVAGQMRKVYDWALGGGTAPDCVRFD